MLHSPEQQELAQRHDLELQLSLWSPSRGVISTEDIPITESAYGKQAVILLPTALEITDAVAKDGLSGRLSSTSLQALQVNAQHGICIFSQLACFTALASLLWYVHSMFAGPCVCQSLPSQML